ncbi:hypothetical protein ACQJBY_041754 [Aegilops geniculata]
MGQQTLSTGMTIPPKPSPAIPTPAAHAAAATASATTTTGCKRTRSEENSLSDGDEPSKQRAKVKTSATIGGDETIEQSQPQDAFKHIAVGSHGNVMSRHQTLLANINSLIPRASIIEVNDDEARFLEKAMSCNIFYMEWANENECIYIWAGDKYSIFKLELHAVFESISTANSETFKCNNPVLSFSHEFGHGKQWKELKRILKQIFGSSQNESMEPDYLYAFTRVGETVHVRIYQLQSIDQSSPDKEIRLMKIAPSFSMKPIEVISGGTCLPLSKPKERMYEENALIDLKPMSVCAYSSGSLVRHAVQHPVISDILLLPCPCDVSHLDGFNSNLDEFLQRRPSTYEAVVPASDPETKYRDITDDFRVFSRSLILIAGAAIKRKSCITGLSRSKILLNRGVAKLNGVKLIPFTEERALKMFRWIRYALMQCMPDGVPSDVQLVLNLLIDRPLEKYDRIVNNPVWMSAWDRCQYLENAYDIFLYELSFQQSIKFAKTKRLQRLIKHWRRQMRKNKLLKDVVRYNQKRPRSYADKTKKEQKKDRLLVKTTMLKNLEERIRGKNKQSVVASDLRALLRCREFFAKCRHAVVHLPGATSELGFLPMPSEKKNLIIASQFAVFYPLIQEGLCEAKSASAQQLGLTKHFRSDVIANEA